jgi:uncharacterized membrane protein
MCAIGSGALTVDRPSPKLKSIIPENRKSQRIASIDWMRGLVMVLMIIDHASMAFDAHHVDHDSSTYFDARSMPLPGTEYRL